MRSRNQKHLFLVLVHPFEPQSTPIARISKEMEQYATFMEVWVKICNDLYYSFQEAKCDKNGKN